MLAAIIFLMSLQTFAQPLGYLGYGFRTESQPSGVGTVTRNPWWMGGGYLWSHLGSTLEFNYYSFESNASYLNIKTEKYELMGWGRYSPFGMVTWWPFLEVGLGLHQSVVDTQFISQSTKSYGTLIGVIGLGVGIWNSVYKGISVGANFRTVWRPKLSTEITYDFIGAIGYQF